jgi:hypothetical protein
MNLRSIRSNAEAETKSTTDPKAPHLFQEPVAVHGSGTCALCSKGRSDPRHKVEEEEQSTGRWGL